MKNLLVFLFTINFFLSFSQTTPLFRSRFEPNTLVVQNFQNNNTSLPYNSAIFQGIDNTVWWPSDWQNVLVNNYAFGNFDQFNVSYDMGTAAQRRAQLVPDPLDPSNTVLKFWIKEAYIDSVKGRVQPSYYNSHVGSNLDGTGFDIFHYSIRLFLPTAIFDSVAENENITIGDDGDLILAQFFNNPGWIENFPDPFGLSLKLVKEQGSQEFNFKVEGLVKNSQNEWTPIWSETNETYSIPIGEWITLDVYLKEGDDIDGMFKLKSSGNEIFNINNYTHHPTPTQDPDGFTHMNPMNLYVWWKELEKFSNDIALYWDDFKIFDDSALKRKFIKLISSDCSTTLTYNNLSLTAQEIPTIGTNGDLPSNWNYQFRFQNTDDANNVFTIIQKNKTVDLSTYAINGQLRENSVYRVRVAIKNHPFIDNYGGSNDNYCEINTLNLFASSAPALMDNEEMFMVYPNPIKDWTTFRYSVFNNLSPSKIYILNEKNQVIKEILNDYRNKGIHEKSISLDNNLSPGKIYFCIFENGHKKIVQRIVLNR
ncbi:hypothetical protein GTQ34_03495 [Muricauda sp. JGD-17]|uniref:Secretion system C-terminal sorting domain-containing protein n=1 Tax=Flagellimonas ochracea TaxID=2696472 RepID=A0A964TB22_9FLAO|nr:hypothetical protein [Allomuricauda ochracea]NAY90974.1 hypothetical protein [Allomuricauda ochracea]